MEKRDTGFNFEKALQAIQNGQPQSIPMEK